MVRALSPADLRHPGFRHQLRCRSKARLQGVLILIFGYIFVHLSVCHSQPMGPKRAEYGPKPQKMDQQELAW